MGRLWSGRDFSEPDRSEPCLERHARGHPPAQGARRRIAVVIAAAAGHLGGRSGVSHVGGGPDDRGVERVAAH